MNGKGREWERGVGHLLKSYTPLTDFSDTAMCLCCLFQAKKVVESAPVKVQRDLHKEEAETLQKALKAVGATVSLDEQSWQL